MVKIDRIEHIVTIPEGVTAEHSEDGVVTITGPKGSLNREFNSTSVAIHQEGGALIVRTDYQEGRPRLWQELGTLT